MSRRLLSPLPRSVNRIVAIAVAVMVFAAISSVIRPSDSSADPLHARTPKPTLGPAPAVFKAPDRDALGNMLIGQLTSADHLVLAYATREGPRYTVCALDGTVLESNLMADDVYRVFPSLNIENMVLDPDEGSQPVMMFDHGS
ncbi:MAG: hypothetical protein KF745_00640 [Phycisphaeraceae bacterium]|nr:hypothetical protein [Phycisphaeraceae bacterium]